MLFLDIETEANPEAIEYLPDPQAPKNYKDPDKIKAYVDGKRQEQIAKAALDPDFGMITAAAIRIGIDGRTVGWLADNPYSEAHLLHILWACMDSTMSHVCGYNIIGFDLPYIIKRSFALGIKPTVYLDLRRYQQRPTTDLMQLLAHWDREKIKSLKFVCKRYGIENPLPELDGSQYAEMDTDTRLAYVKNDVDMTVELYKRMVGYYL